MKIFKNGKSGEYCLFAISMKPQTVRQVKILNQLLEKKYKLKFGDSFIARIAIDEFINRRDAVELLVDKRFKRLIKNGEEADGKEKHGS